MADRTTVTAALATTWAAGLVSGDETVEPRATLRPPDDTVDEVALPAIPLHGDAADYELRGALGAGGMAVVERAWQRSLDREVAIKHALDPSSGKARTAMVREARIAGGLEHPNIVPVHALGRDEHGEAVIVMKRVSGESWRALLRDPDHALWGEGDRLLRNLEILGSVCRAVELAHSRGWLHRDLKTENVMVGEFGEVYVLDWGIAVPRAIAERGEATFAGTPAYMAPEMAAAGVLGPRTDVFLLGAILHEVLTGEPVNGGDSLNAILFAAMTERTRRYPPDAPPELVAIAERATAYHPTDRFEDVAALRRALADFVVHRDALEITERAVAELDAVERGQVEDPRDALTEARSAIRQAQALWAEGPRAAAALDRCLRMLVERELEDDNPAAASTWAAQLEPRDEALEARIEARRVDLERAAAELEALRGYAADRDLRAWASVRRRRALAFGALVAAVGFGGGAAQRAGLFELGYLELGAIFVVTGTVAIVSATVGLARQNLMTRWIGEVMVFAALSPFPVLLTAWRFDLAPEATLAFDALVKAGGSLVLGVFVQRMFKAVALVNLLTAGALLATRTEHVLEVAAGGLAIGLVVAAAGLDRDATPVITRQGGDGRA